MDSFSALLDHLLAEDLPDEDRVTHLLFSHIGHHGYGEEVDARAESRWKRVKEAASELGLPMVRVLSNTPDFYSPQYDAPLNWAATLTLRNASVPLLLQAGVRRFLVASSHRWEQIRIAPTRDMTHADPVLLPALSTERVELCAVGSEHTRVEKTERIADLGLARKYLDVCIMEGDRNCSRCEKCLRTLLTLELLGKLDAFRGRFDLTEYRRHRTRFLAEVLAERADPFHLEIQELIERSGARPPESARVRAALLRGWRTLPPGLRRRLRGGAPQHRA